jgi:hypothetical protein
MQPTRRRPGPSRLTYLLTGVCVAVWPLALAFTIVEGLGLGWVVLTLATVSAACSLTVAYGLPQRRGRH